MAAMRLYGFKIDFNFQIIFLTLLNIHRFVYPFQWGAPTFSVAGTVGLISGVLASMLESLGDYYACADICEIPPPPIHAINRGIMIEGIACIIQVKSVEICL